MAKDFFDVYNKLSFGTSKKKRKDSEAEIVLPKRVLPTESDLKIVESKKKKRKNDGDLSAFDLFNTNKPKEDSEVVPKQKTEKDKVKFYFLCFYINFCLRVST